MCLVVKTIIVASTGLFFFTIFCYNNFNGDTMKNKKILIKKEKDFKSQNNEILTYNKIIENSSNINLGLENAIKSLNSGNINIVKTILPKIQNISGLSNTLNSICEPQREIIDAFIKGFTSSLPNIIYNNIFPFLKEISFTEIIEQEKKMCIIFLKNGFYPSFYIDYNKLPTVTELNENSDISKEIADLVEISLDKYEYKILDYFKNYKSDIAESFELYKDGKYRLCILSLINNISNIFNEEFENESFENVKKIDNKLIEYNVLLDRNANIKDDNYILFAPYLTAENRNDYNMLLCSFKGNNPKENYKDISYNRNSITHGYYNNFGTKINCLRWFSLLMHGYDLISYCKKVRKINR